VEMPREREPLVPDTNKFAILLRMMV
jgi:hypothetical protein